MRFQFHKNESKIIDLIEFPGVTYSNSSEALEEYADIITPEYRDLLKNCEAVLIPHEGDIRLFYSKNVMEDYVFSSLIIKAYEVFGFSCEEDYLNHLLSAEETELRKRLIRSILLRDDDADKRAGASELAEEISLSKDHIRELVDNLSLEDGHKWNLYLMLDSPKRYLVQYVELLYRLLPDFRRLYLSHESRVLQCGMELEEFLNRNEENGLDILSNSILHQDMFPRRTSALYISCMTPYSIKCITDTSFPYLQWGMEMEKSFQLLKEKTENKLNERVLFFKNLGDRTRYEVLRLVAHGVTSTKSMANTLNVSSATISYHVNALVTANILEYEKKNGKTGYQVDWEFIKEVFDGLQEDLKQK